MRKGLCIIAAAFVLAFASIASAADSPRFALLIGNQNYAGAAGPLKGVPESVALIRSALIKTGFAEDNIMVVSDAGRIAMQQAIDRFTAKAAHRGPGAINFVYYSGHAANNEQRGNFLIPVDAPDPSAPSFWYDLVSLPEMLSQLSRQAPDAKSFVVIEACGNLLKAEGVAGTQGIKLKSLQQFREVPNNMLVAHAPAWCELAPSPGGEASLYARALADEIVKPDTDAATVFQNAQAGLFWFQHKAMSGVYFKVQRAPAPPNFNLADLRVSFGDTYDEIKAAYPSAPEPVHANPQGHRMDYVQLKELGILVLFRRARKNQTGAAGRPVEGKRTWRDDW